ncbi:putative exonuclease [Burkholderia phage vB_BpP_HN05]
MSITNVNDVPLALAVWAMFDEYDYVSGVENYISVTTLMKPLRQIVIPPRIPQEKQGRADVMDFISSALGKSLHDSVEKAWTKGYADNLRALGYPDSVIEKIVVNPAYTPSDDQIPIYLEQRVLKKFMGFTIGGKYDLIADGLLQDLKSTTAYTWLYGGKDDDYQLQGSLYRWLNQDKVTEDFIRINFIFTDWQKMSAKQNPKYPQKRVEYKDIPLMTVQETENWVRTKLNQIVMHKNTPEPQLPRCTDEELWRSAPQYKYYSKVETAQAGGRATKNFDTLVEAKTFWMVEKGGVGTVKTVPGEVKRCGYCPAFNGCTQKDEYVINE